MQIPESKELTNNKDNSKAIYLHLKRFFLNREIANFYNYLEAMEKPLQESVQETSLEIQKIKAEIQELGKSDEHRAELIELLVESTRIEGFTNIMRHSFFVSLYSFLELWMIRECHVEGKHRENIKLLLSDLKGNGIKGAKTYFVKALGSEFPFDSSKEWNKITKYHLLRNCIVHRQGSLTGLSDFSIDRTLEKFVEAEDGLYLYGGKQIFMKHEFCIEALQTVHRFLELLLFPKIAS